MKKFIKHPGFILPLLAIFFRFWSFFPPVIDHDESTYLIIARDLSQGSIYLKDVIDTKPIGIFWIYQLLEFLSFGSIGMTRFVASVWIGITAFFIFKFIIKSTQNVNASWFGSISYILIVSIFKNWGVSPNTEIYFNLFTLAAIYLTLFNKTKHIEIISGLLLGFAFITKYVALSEAGVIGSFLIIQASLQNNLNRQLLFKLLKLLVGFIVPICLMLTYFYNYKLLDQFFYFNFDVLSRYPSDITISNSLIFIGDFCGRYFIWILLAIAGLLQLKKRSDLLSILFYIWILYDLIIIVLPGKGFSHYFIQLMIPISLLAGFGSLELFKMQALIKNKRRIVSVCLILIPLIFYFQKQSYYNRKTDITELYTFLSKELKPGERIYTGNSAHILYYLLNLKSPSPYIHASLLWNPEHLEALQLNLNDEADRILESKPRYILIKEPITDSTMLKKIFISYSEIKLIGNKTHVLSIQ
ncbi:MAG: hypothetical protein IPK91_10210 [Saprospiraceae bacterium]|nr:hypothetical protein [Saprospiraceae bacterium]